MYEDEKYKCRVCKTVAEHVENKERKRMRNIRMNAVWKFNENVFIVMLNQVPIKFYGKGN